jgi:hypothetical protein
VVQDNLYGTSIDSIARPAAEKKLVVIHCHPPAIRRLQFFGDVYPLVIFLDPHDRAAAEDILSTWSSTHPINLEEELARAELARLQFSHVFTHAVPMTGSASELITKVAEIISAEWTSDFWAPVPKPLPRTVCIG